MEKRSDNFGVYKTYLIFFSSAIYNIYVFIWLFSFPTYYNIDYFVKLSEKLKVLPENYLDTLNSA